MCILSTPQHQNQTLISNKPSYFMLHSVVFKLMCGWIRLDEWLRRYSSFRDLQCSTPAQLVLSCSVLQHRWFPGVYFACTAISERVKHIASEDSRKRFISMLDFSARRLLWCHVMTRCVEGCMISLVQIPKLPDTDNIQHHRSDWLGVCGPGRHQAVHWAPKFHGHLQDLPVLSQRTDEGKPAAV